VYIGDRFLVKTSATDILLALATLGDTTQEHFYLSFPPIVAKARTEVTVDDIIANVNTA